jgi:TRAP-type C4-dicarboxylate transport system, small permease component
MRGAIVTLIRNIEEIIAGTALVVVVLSVCWGVLTRYITAQPAAWAGELAAISFAWVVFVGASAALKRSMHISIDMFVAALPPVPRRAVNALADAVVLVFLAYSLFLAVEFTAEAWTNPSSVLRIPMSVVYAAVVVGFASFMVRYVQAAWARWRQIDNGAG